MAVSWLTVTELLEISGEFEATTRTLTQVELGQWERVTSELDARGIAA